MICHTWADTEPAYFERLAPLLGPDQPFVAICPPAPATTQLDSTDDWVSFELEQLADLPVTGPIRLVGWSFGGIVALELARALIDGGHGDGLVSIELLDSWVPVRQYRGRIGKAAVRAHKVAGHLDHMESLEGEPRRDYALALARTLAARSRVKIDRGTRKLVERIRATPRPSNPPEPLSAEHRNIWVPWLKYAPQTFTRPVVLYPCARSILHQHGDASLGFAEWLTAGFTVHEVPGGHESMWEHPNVAVLAAALRTAFSPG